MCTGPRCKMYFLHEWGPNRVERPWCRDLVLRLECRQESARQWIKCVFPDPVHRTCLLGICVSQAPGANRWRQVGCEPRPYTLPWTHGLRTKAEGRADRSGKTSPAGLRITANRSVGVSPRSLIRDVASNVLSRRTVARTPENSMCT